ncbi:hypothetical protein OSB04_012773 [Centaurea solstitialis]|uniref:Uncharacterized protein n=1 Tax=Centaurea solstitialis TaxID=347529 RepID=A0AA38TDQ4_9ASTR|nr:hypothetical protein OSB04_012773 [Centaurea solstitialis]
MNTGNGEFSYAKNSTLQEIVIRKAIPILEHTIKSMASLNRDIVFGKCFNIADLGCSSGTNTLLVASIIIDIVHEVCKENNHNAPQFQVYLNDLYGNDFNGIFKLLPDFHAKLTREKGGNFGPCFISAVPGSFYGRLFPDQTLHLIHSSYSVHWLSQVPEGLDDNKSNIYIARTSPQNVLEAYRKQFYSDFTKFLKLRSMELVSGGRMVLIFHGRSIVDPCSSESCRLLGILAQSLVNLLKEGLVQESDINSFNIPCYTPCEDEVRDAINIEGSFSLATMNVFESNWDPYDIDYTNMNDLKEHSRIRAKNAARVLRAIMEPLLTSHFGNSIIDPLFNKYEKHLAEHIANNKKTRYFNVLISLTKK